MGEVCERNFIKFIFNPKGRELSRHRDHLKIQNYCQGTDNERERECV